MDRDFVRAGDWIGKAYVLAASRPLLWIGVSALYLALVALLQGLPLAGDVLIILWTPITIASVFKAVSDPRPTELPLARVLRAFWGVSRDRELRFPVIRAATVFLGAWVFLSVLAMLLRVDSLSFAGLFGHRSLAASALIAALLVSFWSLQIAVILTAFYVLAGIVLAALKPLDALERAADLWRDHPTAICTLGGVFILPLIIAFYFQPWIRGLVGIVTLMPLTLAVYISYGALRPGSTA
ncbi:MAG TPA: hypothetical protein VMV40_10230 [Acidiferrobacter sp.]|nr:hypothetical protein [Acidiferrobacter sp.]